MDRASWDDRFAKDGYLFGTRPSDFLVSQSDRLKGGWKVLAVADGEGRNGVWLAEQGLEVTSVDGSANALNKARALAADRGVALETECVDLLAWEWPQAVFDVVVSIFFHSEPLRRTRLHHAMLRAVRPGGLVIVECFHPDQLGRSTGGPPVLEKLVSAAMLKADFAAADILELEEREERMEISVEDSEPGMAAVTHLVALRPETA